MHRFLVVLRLMNVMTFRNRGILFFSILMPTFSLVLFGVIFGQHQIPLSTGDMNVSYAVWLLPGIIVTNMMATGFMGNSGAMIAWRERGIFKRIAVTPMPIWQVMLARILTQIVIIVAQAIIAIIVGQFLFGYTFNLTYTPLTLAFLILGAIVFLAFGQVIASFTDRVEMGNIISQGLYIILTFLTGVMLPLAILPEAIANVAQYTPSYFIATLLRGAMLQNNAGPSPLLYIGGLLAYFVAALAISAAFFRFIRQ